MSCDSVVLCSYYFLIFIRTKVRRFSRLWVFTPSRLRPIYATPFELQQLRRCRLHSLSSSCRVVVVKTTSACSVLLSPRFHVDHAYKPLCPTLKRLCGQLQGKSSRELCRAVVRSTSRRLFGETSKQLVYSARTRPTSASTECVVKRWHCHIYLQTSLPMSSRRCTLRPTMRRLHSICSTWSASGSAPPPGRLLPGQSSVSRCGPTTTWRAGIVDWTIDRPHWNGSGEYVSSMLGLYTTSDSYITTNDIAHTTPKTLRYRSVLRTFRHQCRNVLGPKCLGSEVSWHLAVRDYPAEPVPAETFTHEEEEGFICILWNLL